MIVLKKHQHLSLVDRVYRVHGHKCNWYILYSGGVGITTSNNKDFIIPNNAEPGDTLVLTKPLGV